MSSLFPPSAVGVEMIPIQKLEVVWPQAQRTSPIRERTIADIVEDFDPHSFGIVKVAINGTGRYHVSDGRHRITALLRMGYTDVEVPCQLRKVKGQEEAAEMFVRLNNSTSPSAIDKFVAGVAAGFGEQVAINAVVESVGLKVAAVPSATHVAAASALVAVYRQHGADVLRVTLETIKATWRGDDDAFHNAIIRGWGTLFGEYAGTIDRVRLASRVSKRHTAASLVGAARSHHNMFGGTVAQGVERISRGLYNHGIRSGQAKLGTDE